MPVRRDVPRRANGPRRAAGICRTGGRGLVLAKESMPAFYRARWPYPDTQYTVVSDDWKYLALLVDVLELPRGERLLCDRVLH